MATTPLVGPEIRDVVQEDVGEERANARPLRSASVRLLLLAALKNDSPQPQLDEPLDARIGDPCATVLSSYSWSTESKKLRMSASSNQFTRSLMTAVCKASSAMRGLRPGRKP